MLRRIATVLALAALLASPIARADEWEEDYTNGGWSDDSPPPSSDDDAVQVDDADDPPVSAETFESSLAPYGDWVTVGSYGRAWRPHVAAGWRPYYYGRWEWTSEGWFWASEEPFGWAAYHYGRWTLEPSYGWVWVPGYEWAPAWVSWRYSGDVVGWAPLGPGVSVYLGATPYVDAWWTFVPCRSFVAEPVFRVAYEPARTRHFFYDTVPAPPRPGDRGLPGRPALAPAWGGPPPRAIEQRIGRPITPVRVVAAPRPGAGRVAPGEVSVFRPGLRAGAPVARPGPSAGREGFAPRGFRPGDAARPSAAPTRPERSPGRSDFGSLDRRPPPSAAPAPEARPGPNRDHGAFPRGWGGTGSSAGRPERSFAPPGNSSPPPSLRPSPGWRESRPSFAEPRREAPRAPERGRWGGERHR